MSKVAVVFWSGSGNTEALADMMLEALEQEGLDTDLYQVSDFDDSMVEEFDAFAFGCPARGSEELDYTEFVPVWDEVKDKLDGKPCVLFGCYGWGPGAWMESWEEDAEDAGVKVLDTLTVLNEPGSDDKQLCKKLAHEIATSL